MIPIFGTAAVLVAPSAPLLSTGYVPGNPLAAQHLNFYLYHLTKELNNVLTAVGMSQSTADDTQITQAIGRTNSVISTSGVVITAAQFVGNALVQFTNAAGSSNYLIGSGAARPGIELIVEALSGSGVMIVNGGGSAFLSAGAVRLLWDGSQWCKIGGNAFLQTFTSGSASTWITPWRGSYKFTAVGQGGGGGGTSSSGTLSNAEGGGCGAVVIKNAAEPAGAVITYTIGLTGGQGGSGGIQNGSAGANSLVSDGSGVSLTATGGPGGTANNNGATNPAPAPSAATGGDINIPGRPGDMGWGGITQGGFGASGMFGGGGAGGQNNNGVAGSGYGSGGGGASSLSSGSHSGAAGAPGLFVIEF